MITYLILGLYLLFTLGIGLVGYRWKQETPDDYFLAGRRVGPLVLFFTLVATNFSAFFFLGMAGAGYENGYSYYGIMAFGTALVPLVFYGVGYRAWKIGKQYGYITPPEMIGDRLQSTPLKITFLVVMVLFTLPYMAIQYIGAGYLLDQLTGGTIPYFAGASLLTVFIVFYVFLGGMRSVAWTDVMQGVLMFVLMFAALWVIVQALGGFREAHAAVYAQKPALFSREGLGLGGRVYTPQTWFSFMILWMLAVPMFPQMFMRFFISRSGKGLKTASALFAVVPMVLFIAPIMIGVLGHLAYPDPSAIEPDRILPLLLAEYAPEALAATVMVGALAAFMSTLDSQLLALSSMLTRDLYLSFLNREASIGQQVWVGRGLVIVLAVLGLGLAYRPPATIFVIATQAFMGLAVLLPTTVAALYWPRANATACLASIVVGEGLLLLTLTGVLPPAWTLGFLPIVPIFLLCIVIIVGGTLYRPQRALAAHS